MYQHQFIEGAVCDLPLGKVVCVGRNYADHIAELNNATPSEPLLFMKPAEAMVCMSAPIGIPTGLGECHNELEVSLLIGEPLSHCSAKQAINAIKGVGLGLDLTLRDVQTQLKQKGHPWERAKSFDGSCPLSHFIPVDELENLSELEFSLNINQVIRQNGNTGMMLFDIPTLLCEISKSFSLSPGDVVLTGTPKGVGELKVGDQLTAELGSHLNIATTIIAR